MKGADRNKPCFCGSGKKTKRCEHPVKSFNEDVGLRVVAREAEPVLEVDDRRGRVSKLLGVAALMMSR